MVSQLLEIIKKFNDKYVKNKEIPFFKSKFEINLFNTFRSYIDYKSFFLLDIKNTTIIRLICRTIEDIHWWSIFVFYYSERVVEVIIFIPEKLRGFLLLQEKP